jgi:hypothetical protein
MIHTRTNTQALRTNKARPARKGVGLRFRLAGERSLAGLARTDFMGMGPLR